MSLHRYRSSQVWIATFVLCQPAFATDMFTAVSAGDMTSGGAILWTQWSNGSVGVTGGTVQISTDQNFSTVQTTTNFNTVVANGNTAKIAVSGLSADTQYFYRFSNGATTSEIGKFYTSSNASAIQPYKIAFTGDYDAKWRPYSVLANFGDASLNPGSGGVKAFINLGDLMYEKSANGSPAVPNLTPNSTPTQVDAAQVDYNRKYLEGISGVAADGSMSASGNQGMKTLLASTGVYSLIDNHELNGALISGGAAQNSLKENLDLSQALNNTGSYINQTDAFRLMSKAFYDNHATAVQINGSATNGYAFTNLQLGDQSVVAPSDSRSNGTAQNYFTRPWGGTATYIQLDDRSYRDARMGDDNTSLASSVANMPGRTMLGNTQLDWLQAQLLAAKSAGVWTVISVSTPIDQWDPNDNKSWLAGYNYERNNLMKFIADNRIEHVVFLTTDDHMSRVTQLKYQPDPINQPNVWLPVPGAFQVLSAPAGAVGPYENATDSRYGSTQDFTINRSVQVLQNQINTKQPDQNALAVGLMSMPGLANVYRRGDANATNNPTAIDFFNATSYGYSTLEWDRFANLRVKYWGIDGYAPNSYPSTTPIPGLIMSFDVHVPYTIAQGTTPVALTDADFNDTDLQSAGMGINRQFRSKWTVNGGLDISGAGGAVSFNGISGSGAIVLGANRLKMTDAADDFSGIISGAGSIELEKGLLRLSGANTYTGGTHVAAGANLVLANSSAIGTGSLNLVGTTTVPATLSIESSITIDNSVTVSGDPVFNVSPGATATMAGVISNGAAVGDVVVDGGGTLSMTAANTYTGPTIVNQGSTLELNGLGSISQSISVTNNGVFNVTGASAPVALGGSYTQGSSGTLVMSAGQMLSVTGAANLAGALNLTGLSNSYSLGQRTALIDAAGGVTGQFAYVSNNLGVASWVDGGVWVFGPSPTATQQAVQQNAQGLGTVINQQLGALQAGLSYDCVKYDINNLCISVGGRYTYAGSGPSGDAQSGLVIVGYRPSTSARVGAFADQSVNISTPGNITQSKNSPMWGLFGTWNANKDGNGLSVEGNAAFSSSALSISRSASYSTEAGQGTTQFGGQGLQFQGNYAYPVTNNLKAIPYLGVRYTRVNLGSYTENGSSQVIAPLSYNAMAQNTFSALAGIGFQSHLAEKLSGSASIGIQQNLSYSMSNYSGTSLIPGMTSFAVSMPNNVNSMATASAGLFYDVKKNERIGLNLLWQQQPFINTTTTSAIATYTIGF